MAETPEIVELELTPIPPDTIASTKQELIPLIEQILHEAGQGNPLSDGHVQIHVEQTFPMDAAIIVGLTFISQLAVHTYKALILERLKQRFGVKEKSSDKEEDESEI